MKLPIIAVWRKTTALYRRLEKSILKRANALRMAARHSSGNSINETAVIPGLGRHACMEAVSYEAAWHVAVRVT